LLQGSPSRLRPPFASFAIAIAPVLLGGWFIYVGIASFAGLADRPIALPQAGMSATFMDDFVVFHSAGAHVSELGGDVYDPPTISVIEAEATGQDPDRVVVLPFFNPPSALLLFSPFALLPLQAAAALWMASGLLIALVSLRWLMRETGGLSQDTTLLAVLGVCSSLPFFHVFLHGQMTFLLLAGFCLYGVGLLRERTAPVLGGLLLLALKPVFLPLPLIYLALRRHFRLLAGFVAIEGALVLMAAILFEPRLPLDYLSMSVKAIGWDEVNGISTYGMFGWTGFWRGILGPDMHAPQMALVAVSSLFTIAAFCWTCRDGKNPLTVLGIMALASLMLSPHSYAQDLILVAFAFLVLSSSDQQNPTWPILAVGAWFAGYVHFDLLPLSSIGTANVALIILTGYAFANALRSGAPALSAAPAYRPTIPHLDAGLSTADAAGS
jgi:hypothetical protein